MSIWDHIGELRTRLLRMLIALVITTFISFSVSNYVIQILMLPLTEVNVNVIAIDVTESVSVFMRVALLSGVILASPYLLLNILQFVLPALTKPEMRWVLFFVIFATLMFILGVVFAYRFMIPAAIPFLVGFLGDVGIVATPRLSNYFNFVTNLLFWIGVSFEMPLIVFVLAKFRVISAGVLLKQWRIAIVLIAVLAAVISPTVDPVNMALLMLPLIFLYLVSIVMAWVAYREKKEKKPKKQKKASN